MMLRFASWRYHSTWRQWLWGRREAKASEVVEPLPPHPVRLEVENVEQEVKVITHKFFPHCSDGCWKDTVLSDVTLKSRVLIAIESAVGREIPSHRLGMLRSIGDVLHFLQSSPKRKQLFPSVDRASLPPNLSLGRPYRVQRKAPERTAFQNFDLPQHQKFPDKKKKRHPASG